ncbi:MAG: hypothetical protein IT372_42470 [Polyangiaceae bacterium]|nr:hypothetical protein [Polyangiaceae bacterium]
MSAERVLRERELVGDLLAGRGAGGWPGRPAIQDPALRVLFLVGSLFVDLYGAIDDERLVGFCEALDVPELLGLTREQLAREVEELRREASLRSGR